jgi:hypothetical protein
VSFKGISEEEEEERGGVGLDFNESQNSRKPPTIYLLRSDFKLLFLSSRCTSTFLS